MTKKRLIYHNQTSLEHTDVRAQKMTPSTVVPYGPYVRVVCNGLNTTAVDRRQLHRNVVTRYPCTKIWYQTQIRIGPWNHISRNTARTTNRWLYSRAINCVPNNETNELDRIARITLCNKVQKMPILFVIYQTSAWNSRQVITAKFIWQFPNSSQTLPPSRTVLRDFITIQIP